MNLRPPRPATRLAGPRPRVLLVFDARQEPSAAALRGVAHYDATYSRWSITVDDRALASVDPRLLFEQPWDGVLSRQTSEALVEACRDRGIPLVDLDDSPAFAGVPKVRPDNRAAGRLGAEHFLDRGFRTFAFAGFSAASWSEERRAGFASTIEAAGFAVTVIESDSANGVIPEWAARRQLQLEACVRSLPKPVAIMACNDVHAEHILQAAQQAGFSTPKDVAVLGVDNECPRCELATPSLSSVALNPTEAGVRAAEWLDRLMGGEPPTVAEVRVPPARLVARHSSDHLAVPHPDIAAAIRFVQENACRGITVADVLAITRLTRPQLEKEFRQHVHRSPHAEIRRVQLARIRQLLADTDMPLKQVAGTTGFEHVEYMTVFFKRATGLCPSTFRQQRRLSRLGGPSRNLLPWEAPPFASERLGFAAV